MQFLNNDRKCFITYPQQLFLSWFDYHRPWICANKLSVALRYCTYLLCHMTEYIAQVKNNRMITINKHSVKQHDFSSSMFHNSVGKKVILLSKTLQLFNRQLWQQTFYSFNSTRSLPSTNLWLGGNFRRLFGGSCRSHFILFFTMSILVTCRHLYLVSTLDFEAIGKIGSDISPFLFIFSFL